MMSGTTSFFEGLLRHVPLPKPSNIKHLPVNAVPIEATVEGNQKKRKTADEAANDEVIGAWYDHLLGSSRKFEVNNFILGPNGDRPFGLECEVILLKDRKLRTEGLALASVLVGCGDVLVNHVAMPHTNEEISEKLTKSNTDDELCPLWFADRGASTSGFNAPLTMKILQKSDMFGELVEKIIRISGNIASIWVSANVKGTHQWHQDGFRSGVNRRNLLTIGGENKIMWFRCKVSGGLFGLRIPHGCLITLSRHAAGVGSSIEHHITGGKNSWLIAFETA